MKRPRKIFKPLPCPFCFGTRVFWRHHWTLGGGIDMFICATCGTNGPSATSRIAAAYLWNTRNPKYSDEVKV